MPSRLAIALATALIAQPLLPSQERPVDEALTAGIRQVGEGDLEGAVITLDRVAQRLEVEKGREKDLATAHLYLAMAHLGLSQWERAKGEMREAWRNNKDMALDPREFPPRVIQLYDETRREARAAESTTSSTKPAPRTVEAPARKGGSKTLWVVLGVAAAGGAAAALAGGGGGEPPPQSTSTSTSTTTTTTTTTTTVPPSPDAVRADLRLNGQNGGTFACQAGLFFSVRVANDTAHAVRVDRFDLRFTPRAVPSGATCVSQSPPVDGTVFDPREIAPGSSAEIRRVDLAGDLCHPPRGTPGCTWSGRLDVQTSSGTRTDNLEFTTR